MKFLLEFHKLGSVVCRLYLVPPTSHQALNTHSVAFLAQSSKLLHNHPKTTCSVLSRQCSSPGTNLCVSYISMVMIKHCNSKQLGEQRVYLLRSIIEGSEGRNLGQEPNRSYGGILLIGLLSQNSNRYFLYHTGSQGWHFNSGQAGLKLVEILLSLFPKCWDYIRMPLHWLYWYSL